jgi:hypothetical protein
MSQPLIKIEIVANDRAGIEQALHALNAQFIAQGVAPVEVSHNGETSVTVAAGPAKPKAQSKAKAKEPATEPTPPAEDKTEQADAPQIENHVDSNATPRDQIKDGIALLQAYFGKNPNNMTEISKLQQKFGVVKFEDITDARAAEFLADAKLVESGVSIAV